MRQIVKKEKEKEEDLSSLELFSLLKPLPEQMDYASVETMAFHVSLQLQVLEEKGYSLLFMKRTDIMVMRGEEEGEEKEEPLYLLYNLTQLVPLNNKDKTQLVLNYPTVYPFDKEVCAPEVMKMSVLPFITSKSASYYSLALLCLKVMQMTTSLDDLRGTKLFYFLERCLKDDPSERINLPIF
jgi:hypothetical protein